MPFSSHRLRLEVQVLRGIEKLLGLRSKPCTVLAISSSVFAMPVTVCASNTSTGGSFSHHSRLIIFLKQINQLRLQKVNSSQQHTFVRA